MNRTDDNELIEERQLLELMKDYPMPAATTGFYDEAMVTAAKEGRRRQQRRWLMTGFGSAVAAGLAIFVVAITLSGTPDVPAVNDGIPGVTIALAEPQTVNLVFSSAEALETATLTVSLPAGVELDGFPGQSEVTWETSLAEGRNLLPLKLVAVTPVGGELLARLEHDDRDRTFRLQVNVG